MREIATKADRDRAGGEDGEIYDEAKMAVAIEFMILALFCSIDSAARSRICSGGGRRQGYPPGVARTMIYTLKSR